MLFRGWIAALSVLLVGGGLGCAMSDTALLNDDDDGGGAYDDDDDYGDDDDDYYGDDDDAADDDDDDADDDDDTTEEPDICDDAPVDETTLYLSADDSNSQAAPAIARQMIEEGTRIYGGMRPYEFLNYYDFYFPPAPEGHVRVVPQLQDDGDGHYTMLIGVVAPSAEDVGRRPRSLTFSVDSSGSMSGHPMAMVKESMRHIAGNLEQGDIVSILSWDTNVTTVLGLEEVDGPDDPDLLQAIDDLSTGGSTNLHQGLVAAYDLATSAYAEDRLNRVFLLSDGGANTGVTDEELIADHADDSEAEGIYMVGVGADDHAGNYSDQLMDAITDAGKGAYVYIDTADEAGAIFGDDDRFLSVMEIAARGVQVGMTMPAGFVMEEFHGEEYSEDPTEVEPQHLSPGDAMLFHQQLMDCATDLHDGDTEFVFTATWTDPVTREAREDSVTMTIDEMLDAAGAQLRKSNVVVAYAQALVDVWDITQPQARADYIQSVADLADEAYVDTGDTDLAAIRDLLLQYKTVVD